MDLILTAFLHYQDELPTFGRTVIPLVQHDAPERAVDHWEPEARAEVLSGFVNAALAPRNTKDAATKIEWRRTMAKRSHS